jgi:predicted transcriptional regulator
MESKTTTISVRVTEETKKRLNIIAHFWRESKTQTIVVLIDDYFSNLAENKLLLNKIIESMEGKE